MGASNEIPRSNTALVFGATGYTGSAVVNHWASLGPVVAHVRPDSKALARHADHFRQWGARVEQVPWDDTSIAALVERTQPGVVFSLLGTTRARAKHELSASDAANPYAAIDERLTLIAARATKAHAPSALFVYLSALGVSDTTENPYLAARRNVEQQLDQLGLRHVIARPAFVTGSDRVEFRLGERAAAVVSDALLDGLALTGINGLRKLRNKFASLTGDELARALVSLARKPPKNIEVLPDELRKRAHARSGS